MKTAAINARIQPEVKEEAESVLEKLGLSSAEAIRLFYRQIILRQGLPFEVRVPNVETEAALEDSRAGRNLEHFDSAGALFASWKE